MPADSRPLHVDQGARSNKEFLALAPPSSLRQHRPTSVRLSSGGTPTSPPAQSAAGRIAAESGARTDGAPVILNFVEADLKDVAKVVLGDYLQMNYLLDPEVQGTVTLQTSSPVPRQQLIGLLTNVLQSRSLSLIDVGGLVAIVPTQKMDSYRSGLADPASAIPGVPSAGVQVIDLRFISAGELKRLVAPFLGPDTRIEIDPSRNRLLVSAQPRELAVLQDFAALFDTDRFRGMVIELYRLAGGRASHVAADLKAVFGAELLGIDGGAIQVVPIDRINAIILASPQGAYVERAKEMIALMATDEGSTERRLYVYEVQNGRADRLAATLSEAFDPGSTSPGENASRRPDLAPGLKPTEVQVQTGESFPGTNLDLPGRGDEQHPVRVVADRATNALLILARPDEYALVREALERLDVLPLEVLLEATIAEVSLNDALRYGVEWFFRFGNVQANLSQATSGEVSPQSPGFSFLFRSDNDVRVVLNALEAVADVNVISSPQLLVLDNQTARLQVGDQVPIAVQQVQSVTSPDAPVVNAVEYRDTGVILEVTPRVNPSGLAVLEIGQEVSDVVPTTTSGLDSPTIRQRRINSTVAVQSGETVALGGLIRDNRTDTRDGVPVLSNLPVVGALFGSRTKNASRTELLVLITPRVIRSMAEAKAVTDELRARLHAIDLGRLATP